LSRGIPANARPAILRLKPIFSPNSIEIRRLALEGISRRSTKPFVIFIRDFVR